MLSTHDERKGLVKTYWKNVRNRVNKVAPQFAEIIDLLSPDESFPLYLTYYPFGDLKGDTISTFLPKIEGGNYRLIDPLVPKDVRDNLGYGSSSSPFGMLLEKKLEYFIDLKNMGITIPWQICSPGEFFPLARILQNQSNRIYSPNGLLSVVSGARSVFMLPKIGCATHYLMLKRNFNVQPQPPKSLYEHWSIFKDIINSDGSNPWRSCVLYFSKKWVDKINNDKAWFPVKKLLLEIAWSKYEYKMNHIYYHSAYSLIQSKRNLKPNPYLNDTACHLFTVALGAVPGYAPANDNEALPFEVLQHAFVEGYGLKKYIPTIINPVHFVFEKKSSHPVYYSLQYPSSMSFSPRSRKLSSTLFEMRELKHIVNVFNSELAKESNILSDTVISDVAKKVAFDFFHNQSDIHKLVRSSNNIPEDDKRFTAKCAGISADGSRFASDAPFVRGCIRISVK